MQMGLTLNELLHCLDEQCVAAGSHLPKTYHCVRNHLRTLRRTHQRNEIPLLHELWRIKQVNLGLTMPQVISGQCNNNLCGKRWISKFDFASGFYACPVSQEKQPYAAFYAGPRGYMTWNRMPFGFTGAPPLSMGNS